MPAKYTYETKKTCGVCKREVDAVRASDIEGLRISRHMRPSEITLGFCRGSLTEVETRPNSQGRR